MTILLKSSYSRYLDTEWVGKFIGKNVDTLVQGFDSENLQVGSIDLRLGSIKTRAGNSWVDTRIDDPYVMYPGETVLAGTIEVLNLDMQFNIAGMFCNKSNNARNFMETESAGWVDPGFRGNITAEIRNNNPHLGLKLIHGMPIGQIVFHRTEQISDDTPYGKNSGSHFQEQSGATPPHQVLTVEWPYRR